jgi:hypothetical protein
MCVVKGGPGDDNQIVTAIRMSTLFVEKKATDFGQLYLANVIQ